jgi:hypothetical protein
VRFENNRIYTRDKSHVKVVNKAAVPLSQRKQKEQSRNEEQKRYELYDTDETDNEEPEEEIVWSEN